MIESRKIGSAVVTALEVQSEDRRTKDLITDLVGTKEAEVVSIMERAFGGSFRWSFAPALIRTPHNSVLFDTGNGFTTGPGRPLEQLLEAAKVRPDELSRIVISHAHGDHIGGLIEDGRPTFRSVRLVFSTKELQYWRSDAAEERYGGADVAAARKVFESYGPSIDVVDPDAGRSTGDGGSLNPGQLILEDGDTVLRSLPIAGHTPGHMGIELASGGQRLWLLADASHFLVQLKRPDWSPVFDADPEAGAAARRRVFEAAATEGILLHMFHYPFPGFGRIVREGDAFAWRPDSPA